MSMTPAEIAETLINGNISTARYAILYGDDSPTAKAPIAYEVAVTTLAVLDELVSLLLEQQPHELAAQCHHDAHEKLRRCLEGHA